MARQWLLTQQTSPLLSPLQPLLQMGRMGGLIAESLFGAGRARWQ